MRTLFEGSISEAFLLGVLTDYRDFEALSARMNRAGSPAEIDAVAAEMREKLKSMQGTSSSWAQKELLGVYNEDFRGNGGVKKTPAQASRFKRERDKVDAGLKRAFTSANKWVRDRTNSEKISRAAKLQEPRLKKIAQALQAPNLKPHERQAFEKAKREIEEGLQAARKQTRFTTDDQPRVYYKPNARAPLGRAVPLDRYLDMAFQTGHRMAVSQAALDAFGTEWVFVYDGSNCGWSRHDDPMKAHGQVMPMVEAVKHKLAHPYCERYFAPCSGPPGSKQTKKQLQERFGQSSTKAIQAEMSKTNITRALSAGVQTATVAARLLDSNFVRRTINGILNDTEINLPAPMERLLRQVYDFSARESQVLKIRGASIGVQTEAELREKIMGEVDDTFANNAFLSAKDGDRVLVSDHMREVLGFRTAPTKRALIDRLHDYSDYGDSHLNNVVDMTERLRINAVTRGAIEEMSEDAALSFELSEPRGMRPLQNWKRIVYNLQKEFNVDPQRATVELTRILAASFDPLPWARVKHGPFRFSVGMSSEGRQDLAEKLMLKLSGASKYSPLEREWAQGIGLALDTSKQITVEDLARAMIPRFSFRPGGPMHFTIGLENGRFAPVFRLYPDGTIARLFSLKSEIKSPDMIDFIKKMRSDAPFTKAELNEFLRENWSFTNSIDVWRNGPVRAGLRFHGTQFDGYALKVRPRSDFVRLTYRYRKPGMDEIIGYDTAGQPITAKGLIRGHNLEFVALPSQTGGATVYWGGKDVDSVLIGLHVLRGNLIEVARETRWGLDSILEWWQYAKKKYGDYRRIVNMEQVRRITNWPELKTYLRRVINFGDDESVELVASTAAKAGNGAGRATEVLRSDIAHKSLKADITRFNRAWSQIYPNIDPPEFRLIPEGKHELFYREGVIWIREDAAANWSDLNRIRKVAVRTGHFPQGTSGSSASLWHEAGHYVVDRLTNNQYRRVWLDVFGSRWWPGSKTKTDEVVDVVSGTGQERFRHASNVPQIPDINMQRSQINILVRQWLTNSAVGKSVQKNVSGYARTSPEELLAEAYAEYLTNPSPRPVARAVGEAVSRYLGHRLRVVT